VAPALDLIVTSLLSAWRSGMGGRVWSCPGRSGGTGGLKGNRSGSWRSGTMSTGGRCGRRWAAPSWAPSARTVVPAVARGGVPAVRYRQLADADAVHAGRDGERVI